jgi:hypothetical protein
MQQVQTSVLPWESCEEPRRRNPWAAVGKRVAEAPVHQDRRLAVLILRQRIGRRCGLEWASVRSTDPALRPDHSSCSL